MLKIVLPTRAVGCGDNAVGQLGDGANADSHIPVAVSGLSDVTALSEGQSTGLALTADGNVWEWGNSQSNVPVQVQGLSGITAIASGLLHNLALKSDGTVWAWGFNGDGETWQWIDCFIRYAGTGHRFEQHHRDHRG